ncbi:MAG: MMPL family transporter [Clostridia bacterium]|nr:MMPL family transporter [Clostridia bacterium]
MIEKFANKLTRKPKLIAIIAAILLIPSALGYVGTKVNYDILSYLPDNLQSSKGMDMLEEPFRMAATGMLIVEDMPSGYTNELINEIKNVEGVGNAIWVSNIVGIQVPSNMIPEDLRQMFFSGKGTMMIIQYENPCASEETMAAIEEIRSICNSKCYLAGFSVVIKDTRDIINKELPLFILVAVVLSLAAMMLTLESTVLPGVLLANIGIAIIYNFGSNIVLGEISYITQAIAAVLQLGVTMDYSVFLYRRFEEELKNYEDPRDAMAQAVVAAFKSLTGSSLTTIAGFLALCFMQLTLGKDIGIVMAKGVVLGIVTVILVLPALILIFAKQIDSHKHRCLIPSFERVNQWIIKHRAVFAAIAVIVFLPAYWAQSHAPVYYKLDESLPRDLPSIVANEKLKDEFDMATSHFVVMKDDFTNSELNEMENRIEELPGISSLVSYNAMLGAGIPSFFIPSEITDMCKKDGYQLMMINSKYATASAEAGEQIDALNSILRDYDPDAMLTGEAALTEDLIKTMAVDFKVTNIISVAAIAVIIAIVFKSISIPVVLVAAIELAIYINQGIPYFTDTPVAFVAPTLISCIQLGATVDYAILMTSRFQEELQSGKDRFEAVRIAANTSDESIITSALVMLCATMGVSFVSSIDMIGDICIMLARGAVISAVMSIFFLPAILCVCEPLFNKTTLNWRTKKEKSLLKQQ